jgi:hypothetical protein
MDALNDWVKSGKTWLLTAAGIIVTVVLAGCSTGPVIVNEWRSPEYGAGNFKRILIAGPSGQATLRRNIEDEFATRFRTSGVEALPSYLYIADDEKVDENNVKQAALHVGADAIVFARPIRVESRMQSPAAYPWTWIGIGGPNVGVSMSGAPGMYSASHYNEYTAETSLFDVARNEVIWSGTIKTEESENARTAIKSYVDTVMKTLDEKNLVRQRQ